MPKHFTNSHALTMLPELTKVDSLKTLVENRTIYNLDSFELNLFETYQQSHLVSLEFNDLVVTSMLRGKKMMHLFDEPAFEYLPGESVIVPANVEMRIDFPEAAMENPTQCIALAIDNKKILDTLAFLNERYPKEGKGDYWNLDERNFFFYNNAEMSLAIQKMIHICQSNSLSKDVLADLSLQELLIHIAQCQNLKQVREDGGYTSHPQLNLVLEQIRMHLSEKIYLPKMASQVGLSMASLYRLFKRELGISPLEYIVLERIKLAKKLLKDRSIYVKNVSFEVGFDDCNYFIRAFKHHEGITPKQYQQLNNKAS